ncbi:hypothetical protein SASPL_147686 [Salvia splendens]|uniref:Uncharacterized protein n=1 Tax=Salvia splendens TaxID=180675 RepID=A0A8X8WEX7_SALSN|nr:hypothetical protein SASPL_147686 [Salvia splendens]
MTLSPNRKAETIEQEMEKLQQHQWSRAVKSRLSYKNATILVCLFNITTVLLLLHGFLYSPSSKSPISNKALYRHIKESEDIRRTLIPRDLIKRVSIVTVREIGEDLYVETEQILQKDAKQTAAVDLRSRLNNFRSYSDAGSNKGHSLSLFEPLSFSLHLRSGASGRWRGRGNVLWERMERPAPSLIELLFVARWSSFH